MAVAGASQACWLGFAWGEAAPFACVDRSVMERSPFACVSCRCLVWEEDMKESLTYSAVGFSRSLEASFIGSNADPDERYAPRILSNTKSSGNVLSVLKSELRTCASFDFSVAFITAGGIQVLTKILADLQARGIRRRILTSTYLNFNEPDNRVVDRFV